MFRKDMVLIPFIGLPGYVVYRLVQRGIGKLNDDKYFKICEDIVIDMKLNMEEIISGEYELTEEELTRLARVYHLRTGRDIFEDVFIEE